MSDFSEPSATPQRHILPNGLCVITQQAPQPGLFSAQLWFKTGSIHEGALQGCGVSHYLEHMLFKGTARRGPLDISAEVNNLGGAINAYTTYDRTVYYIDGPAEALGDALDILLDMGFCAALPEDEAERERDVILREIDMGLDDPDRVLMQAFTQTAFREHPYRHPIIGWRELFEGVSAADLRGYYESRYSPDNAVLILVADQPADELVTLAQSLAGGIRRRKVSPAAVLPEPPQLSQRELRLRTDSQVVRGIMGYRIPGLNTPHAATLDVLGRLLGGGQSSLLWQTLREERELVHSVSAGCWNPGSQGLLWISYTCDAGKREAVESAIRDTLATARNTLFDAKAVDKVIRQALVAELNSKRTVSGIAARLGAAEVVLGDLGYPARHLELLRGVTAQAVADAARAYLIADGETAVSLEPHNTLAKNTANASAANSATASAAPAAARSTITSAATADTAQPATVSVQDDKPAPAENAATCGDSAAFSGTGAQQPAAAPTIILRNHAAATPFETITLPNGARLLLQEDNSVPKVHFRFGALGSGLWEAPQRRGATGIFASLLTRDTRKRSATAVAAQIEQVGGSFSEFVGNNTFGIGIEVLSEDAMLAADLLGEALLRRRSSEKSFELERDGQIASLLEDEDELIDWARRRLRAQFFGNHPYAVDFLGREADLRALSLAETNALGEALLCGENAVLAVSGQFDRNTIAAELLPILAALPATPLPAPAYCDNTAAAANNNLPYPVLPAGLAAENSVRLRREREQAVVLVGYPDAGVRAQLPFAVGEVLDEIFSGMSSRLFRRVREEQGLAYYVGAERMSGLDRGLFSFYAGTAGEHVDRVAAAIDEEVQRAASGGITAEELATAKLRLRVRQRQARQLSGSRAMKAVLNTLYGKAANSAAEEEALLDAVCAASLQQFAATCFAPQLRQTLIVTP